MAEKIDMPECPFGGWAIVELMGHRRLGGLVSGVQWGGVSFLRVDVPGPAGTTAATQFYAPASIYCITPTTEEIARAVAANNQVQPVSRWELPAPADSAGPGRDDFSGLEDEEDML